MMANANADPSDSSPVPGRAALGTVASGIATSGAVLELSELLTTLLPPVLGKAALVVVSGDVVPPVLSSEIGAGDGVADREALSDVVGDEDWAAFPSTLLPLAVPLE